jgi:hypothetical protein
MAIKINGTSERYEITEKTEKGLKNMQESKNRTEKIMELNNS